METERITLKGIPALLIGEPSRKVYSLRPRKNGQQRGSPCICRAGLPGRLSGAGHRPARTWRAEERPGTAPAMGGRSGVEFMDQYARVHWRQVLLRATSIGAWFSMLALQEKALRRALFVSLIVDMEDLIGRMMQQANVTEEQLQAAGRSPQLSGRRFRGRISAGCGSIRSAGAPPRRCSMAKPTR